MRGGWRHGHFERVVLGERGSGRLAGQVLADSHVVLLSLVSNDGGPGPPPFVWQACRLAPSVRASGRRGRMLKGHRCRVSKALPKVRRHWSAAVGGGGKGCSRRVRGVHGGMGGASAPPWGAVFWPTAYSRERLCALWFQGRMVVARPALAGMTRGLGVSG
ncbi:hypothetical protein PCLA_10r0151 [Pseudomonas citronellolis]|nr:hypothetical protein PCLA_10r0151 [Pseudomonas citronellolis]